MTAKKKMDHSKTYLIFSDLHHRYKIVEFIISTLREERKRQIDQIIFLGDYFDSKQHTTLDDAEGTAEWLHNSLQQPDRVHLVGNHDAPYFLTNPAASSVRACPTDYWCPGFSIEKLHLIRKHITEEDIAKIKAMHYANDFLFSHAGILEQLIPSNLDKHEGATDAERITSYVNSEYKELFVDKKIYDRPYPVFKYGARMGEPFPGGVTWADWNDEFVPIPGLNQIVGHTPANYYRENSLPELVSINYAVDTANQHVYIMQEGSNLLEVIELH